MSPKDQIIVVEAGAGLKQYWTDLWRYRELIGFLAWRDLSVRYKQTVLGIIWSALRPVLITVVFTIIFGRLAQFPSDGIPYPAVVLSGLLAWQFFASALESTSASVVTNANLVSKVYFPRLIIPVSALAVSVVDMLISACILAGVMLWYGILPGLQVFWLPLFLLLVALCTLGLGFWFSALSAKYRDFRIIVPFLIQFGFYLSPVGFATNIIPPQWQLIYSLNPMVGLIEGVRWCLLPGFTRPQTMVLIISGIISLLLFFSGLLFFRSREREFADVI